jgi:hypothetical protein
MNTQIRRRQAMRLAILVEQVEDARVREALTPLEFVSRISEDPEELIRDFLQRDTTYGDAQRPPNTSCLSLLWLPTSDTKLASNCERPTQTLEHNFSRKKCL